MKKIIKNIKSLLLFGVMVMIGTSCSDFLVENPKSDISLISYFTDKEHAYTAVNRLYRDGPYDIYNGYGSAYSGSIGMVYDHLSGFYNNEYKGQELYVIAAQNLDVDASQLNDVANSIWSSQYYEISNANTAIKGIPEVPELNDDEKNYQIAQAKFFRAFSYFILLRTFGDVPLITEPYESVENVYVARTASLDVYNQVIEDLEFASLYLKDKVMEANSGRVTKGAAQTLLAEVYLSMSGYPLNVDRYAEAATQAKEVISSGVYDLLTNDDNTTGSAYNKMRSETNDDSKEYIYYIEYLEGESNSPYASWSLPSNNIHSNIGIHVNTFEPMQELIDLYDSSNDLRVKENQFYYSTLGGDAFDAWAPWLWFNDHAHESSISSKNFVVYRYTDVLLIAAESLARSGGSLSEAAGYLAKVKARASLNLSESEIITALSSLSVQEFIEEVWTERYRESAFEFKAWFTMIRTKKYPVGDGSGSVNYVDLIGHTNRWGATYTERDLLWQLPEQEMQKNPDLIPNP
ncbi:MAG: RagB/SusD family nutrient uptake outer membrane protein [Labilibaculum sp.]|nr:RagB/SusD family nutrient uptake outer membrane protein [Labilibaculum sp.]